MAFMQLRLSGWPLVYFLSIFSIGLLLGPWSPFGRHDEPQSSEEKAIVRDHLLLLPAGQAVKILDHHGSHARVRVTGHRPESSLQRTGALISRTIEPNL